MPTRPTDATKAPRVVPGGPLTDAQVARDLLSAGEARFSTRTDLTASRQAESMSLAEDMTSSPATPTGRSRTMRELTENPAVRAALRSGERERERERERALERDRLTTRAETSHHSISIAEIEPPVLRTWSKKSLREWMEERSLYIAKVHGQADMGYGFSVAPMRACFSKNAMQYVSAFVFSKRFDEITEEELEGKVREMLEEDEPRVDPDDIACDLQREWAELRRECSDAPERVAMMFTKLIQVLGSYGIKWDADNLPWDKFFCKELVNALAPVAFKRRIEKLRRTRRDFPDGDIAELHKLLMTEAEIYEQYMIGYGSGPKRTPDSNADHRDRRAYERDSGSSRGERDNHSRHGVAVKADTPRRSGADRSGMTQSRSTGMAKKCFACGTEGHRVADCPKLSAADRSRPLGVLRAEGKLSATITTTTTAGSSQSKPSSSRVAAVGNTDGVRCLLDDTIELPCVLDSGADTVLMGRNHLDLLQQSGKFIKMRQLQPPVSCHTFSNDLEPLLCGTEVEVRLTFPTQWGPVVTPLTKVRVLDGELDAVFVGEPVLRPLGWMPDQHLENTAKRAVCSDYSHAAAQLAGLIADSPVGDSGDLELGLALGDRELEADDPGSDDEPSLLGMNKDRDVSSNVLSVHDAVRTMVSKAVADGLNERWASVLLDELLHMDLWRMELGADPPASVAPFQVTLRPDATPFKAKVRRQSDMQRASLRAELDQMVELGLMYVNPNARWGSAGMHLPKPNGRGMRMVVDLRGVNARTVPLSWPLPDREQQERSLRGAGMFATFDLFKGFWQVPCHPDCQEWYTIVTDFGCYTPTRMMMGATDAAQYFQYCVTQCLGDCLDRCAQVWIDDLLVFSSDQEKHVQNVLEVLRKLELAGWKADPRKAVLYSEKVTWCGRVYSSGGMECAPERVETILKMEPPKTLGNLQQLLGALSWMRNHLPDYARVVCPLQDLLDAGLSALPKRTRRCSDNVQLDAVGWSQEHDVAFVSMKDMIAHAVRLAHHDPDCDVKIFTDASETHWAVACVQMPADDADKPIDEQRMQPLAFLSGTFRGSSRRWSVIDKEAYPIVQACEKLDYLLFRERGFTFMTDHRNLRYIFEPLRVDVSARKATVDRVHRWAMGLQRFRYKIEHVSGSQNLWADLLTRWAAKPVSCSVRAVNLHLNNPDSVDWNIVGPATEGFDTLNMDDIRLAQVLALTEEELPGIANRAVTKDDFLAVADKLQDQNGLAFDEAHLVICNARGCIWIPAEAKGLQLRICVMAHAGLNGHRGVDVTQRRVKSKFYWNGMDATMTKFVRQCLHCRGAKGPYLHPRPFGETLAGQRPNQVVHFDFLFMERSKKNKFTYLLALKDGFSGYVDLVPCVDATAATAAEALLMWIARFGTPTTWVSDRGPHFFNRLVAEIARCCGIDHHFTTARCPWANGSIERANREVLNVFRTMLSEVKLPTSEWTSLLPMVIHVLNSAPSPTRDNLSAFEAFLGRKEVEPLEVILGLEEGAVVQVGDAVNRMAAHVQRLRDVIEHNVDRIRASKAKQQRQPYDAEFAVGEYVLYYDVHRRRGKLQTKKVGPMLVVQAESPWIYRLRNVVTNDEVQAHAQRMEKYADAGLGVTEALKEHVTYHQTSYEVEKLLDVRHNSEGKWEFLVKWWGFSNDEATWEDVSVLVDDIPLLVLEFLDSKDVPEECKEYVRILLQKT